MCSNPERTGQFMFAPGYLSQSVEGQRRATATDGSLLQVASFYQPNSITSDTRTSRRGATPAGGHQDRVPEGRAGTSG